MLLEPHHVAATVSDIDRSISFYEALGFEVLGMFELDGGARTLVQMRLGEQMLELVAYSDGGATRPAPPADQQLGLSHLGLRTDDIYATLAELRALGIVDADIEVRSTPIGMQIAFFRDPDGIAIELLQAAEEA
jgi:lactoylglutathione lyase